MEVFGKRWLGYMEKIKKNWEAAVTENDTVVVPGDISWAMNLEEALEDFLFLESLPGHKLIGKGNHDFWWTTNQKMTRFFEEHGIKSVHILNNNAYVIEDSIICGTRGWFLDEKQQVAVGSVDYAKIINREVIRLKLSLDEVNTGRVLPIAVFLHFPPVWLDFICREFVDVLHEYGITECYFGHIHGMYNHPRSFEFEGITMTLCASDYLDFSLMPVVVGEK